MKKNKKSILLIHTSDIKDFPPVLSLLENLINHHHKVTFITKDENKMLTIKSPYLRVINLHPKRYATMMGNLLLHKQYQTWLCALVVRLMETHDVLWTTTDATVRELGDVVLCYRHVMQLLELIEDIPLFPYQSVLGLRIERYAQKAWKVVVPEYHRAHIQKTWWHLQSTPVILPNKPYSVLETQKVSPFMDKVIRKMQAEPRKIVLYQGIFDDDRNLEPYAKAVRLLNDHFCMYIMGKENDNCTSFLKKFPEVQYIPFVAPPSHLLITKNADIGILPYVPIKTFHYSELNALFCAPNKIYEYAVCGLPMLGSNVPGLAIPFEKYGIGEVCDGNNSFEIAEKLVTLQKRYGDYQSNCRHFFDSVDLDDIVERQILEEK